MSPTPGHPQSSPPPPRMAHGVKIVIAILLFVVVLVFGVAYSFIKLATP